MDSLTFINSAEDIKLLLIEIDGNVKTSGYKLEELARRYDFTKEVELPELAQLHESKLLSDKHANNFITYLASGKLFEKLGNFKVEPHPELVFNNWKVDGLPEIYESQNNKADVSIVVVSGQGSDQKHTNLSNPHPAVVKAICGIYQLLRVVKGHCPDCLIKA